MRIRITKTPLTKYQTKGQVDENDTWIRKIMEYEASKGGYDNYSGAFGLPNWGYNDWQKLGHSSAPSSIEDAIGYFREDFLPKVKQYPMGLRERMGDYIYNTGRNPNDLLLYNAGKITLDQLNSSNSFTNEWNQYGPEIQKMYGDEAFINKLDQSKDDVYRTTRQPKPGFPNPAYSGTWQGRVNMWGRYKAPSQQSSAQPTQQTSSAPWHSSWGMTDDGYGNMIPDEPAKFNVTDYSKLPTGNAAATPNTPFTGYLFPGPYTVTERLRGPQKGMINSTRGFVSKEDTDALENYDWKNFDWNSAPVDPTAQSRYNDMMNIMQTGSKKDLRQSIENYNKDFGTKIKKPGLFTMGAESRENMNKLADTFGKIGTGIKVGTIIGSGITNLIDARKKEKEFNRWKRSQLNSDYQYMPVEGTRGDYVATGSRFGEFRPDDYVVNKGMYTGQFFPRMMQSGGVIPEALSFPITPMEANITTAPAVEPEASSSTESSSKSYRSSGANEEAEQTWSDVSTEFKGVQNWGIWGDARHRKTKSDHNTGDALDIGISNAEQGTQIAQKLIKEAQDRNIKYIIWNRQIWNPSVSNEWRPYSGESPHTDHVHVSFNRNPETLGQISLTHNNPLNIHHGDFAQQYGGKQGSKDGGGFVSKFPDFETGIRAAKDLLFGPNYSNLTISQARNKWVKGDPGVTSESSSHIVKAMGADKRLSELSPGEKEQLLKLFAKWEGKQAYNKLKGMKLFQEGGLVSYAQGGVYELTEDEIKAVMAAGGEIEFI